MKLRVIEMQWIGEFYFYGHWTLFYMCSKMRGKLLRWNRKFKAEGGEENGGGGEASNIGERLYPTGPLFLPSFLSSASYSHPLSFFIRPE